jgi:hypothetical protein
MAAAADTEESKVPTLATFAARTEEFKARLHDRHVDESSEIALVVALFARAKDFSSWFLAPTELSARIAATSWPDTRMAVEVIFDSLKSGNSI